MGIDVGGTTVKCGIFTYNGVLLDKWEVMTRKAENGKYILPDVAEELKKHLDEKTISYEDIAGIGIGVPGPVEPDGHVRVAVNLGWKDIYPARVMRELMGGRIPCAVGNDANVAALGEMWQCGGMGCLEQVASATGIVKEAERFLRMFREPSSLRIYGKALTAKIVCDAAKEGDQLAYLSLDLSMRSLGIVLAQVSMVADPEIFVIGGGVSKAGDFLLDLIRKHYKEYTPILEKKAELVLATLGNDAGIYGCARLMLEKD